MTQGKEWKVILLFAAPMLLGNILQQAYTLVDSIVVGQYLGKEALAATGTTWPVLYIFIALVIGVGSGNTVVIAQYFGAKKISEVKKAVATQLIFLFCTAFLVSIIGYFFHRPLLRLLNVPTHVLEIASEYFVIMMYGLPLLFGYNAIASILRGLGDSRTPLMFMLISTLLNIALSVTFVVYCGWGVASVAWATVIAQGIAFLAAALYLNHSHPILSFTKEEFCFSKQLFYQSMKLGLPTGMQQVTVAIGILAVWGIVNKFGDNIMAGYTTAVRIDGMAIMPAMLIGSALTAFVGQNTGGQQTLRIKRAFIATIWIGLSLSAIISASIYLFDTELINLFLPKKELDNLQAITCAENYLHIVTPFYLVFATLFAFHGLFRGAGESLIPMYITILSLWGFRIPLAYLLSKGLLQENGIWWSIPIAWCIGLISSFIYYQTGRWKEKSIVKNH